MRNGECEAACLFLEPRVLHAQLLLVEVVVGDGRAAAGGADDVTERLPHGDVLAPDLVVLRAQEAVVLPLVLCLQYAPIQRPNIPKLMAVVSNRSANQIEDKHQQR